MNSIGTSLSFCFDGENSSNWLADDFTLNLTTVNLLKMFESLVKACMLPEQMTLTYKF